ncbi:MAG TPA: aminotransferase class V-fold PLP-dependent enzyme [Thermoanaerobaculia bacterium]|nr:aminotransferase class V-fold PLP-dependent enzyme [Thermoanaerobaculia bacterium]HUM29989.1 aminotransferase class V-fold PLP-dependent enzyme [Thermoanaerobaculia bacterium]HXK68322.1 aminotransferase class V-fold PLP-dependent enzyme [Thermoanaerobaculia bacterium]
MNDPFLSFRSLFPAYSEGVYVNHAAVAPFSTTVRETLLDYWSRRSRIPVDVYPELVELKTRFRNLMARLIGARDPGMVAFLPNTGEGLNIVARGIPWKEGDRILLNPIEFPANIYPFMNLENLGVILDWVEPVNGRILPDEIARRITPRTRLFSISHVQFSNGFRADLAEIGSLCQEQGIWFVVDGIQGVGVAPMDVDTWGVDALSAGGHKWLMWPMGTGFLYTSPRLFKTMQPAYAGWLSVKDAWNFLDYKLDLADSAERFEHGTMNFIGLVVACQVLETFLELGIAAIHERIMNLTEQLIQGTAARGMECISPGKRSERSGIVSYRIPDAEGVVQSLQKHNIWAAARSGILRFSPHCTNTPEDIEQILSILHTIRVIS